MRTYTPAELASEDLLNLVDDTEIMDLRSVAQTSFMDSLIGQIAQLDAKAGEAALAYTVHMTDQGKWTAGRNGNASDWISRMIAKVKQLKELAPAEPKTTASPQVADGRYAVRMGDVVKFYRVKNGYKPGFVFLDVQASDELHSIRNAGVKAQILAEIAKDARGAMELYGQELGICGMCSRTLTDEESRRIGIGPICRNK